MSEDGAGAVELKEFLDNFDKGEEIQPTTTIWDNLTYVLDDWLQNISVLREITTSRERINRTLQQIQLDGLVTIYNFELLWYIGHICSDFISLLSSSD